MIIGVIDKKFYFCYLKKKTFQTKRIKTKRNNLHHNKEILWTKLTSLHVFKNLLALSLGKICPHITVRNCLHKWHNVFTIFFFFFLLTPHGPSGRRGPTRRKVNISSSLWQEWVSLPFVSHYSLCQDMRGAVKYKSIMTFKTKASNKYDNQVDSSNWLNTKIN